jgi:dTDP-4-dehydrorhamnose 3,5-epimerase
VNVVETGLAGVRVLEPKVFEDDRGFFAEVFHLERYDEVGVSHPFVQDNHSRSVCGVLRGLHFQAGSGQGKLVRASQGSIFDVAVDIVPESSTFGEWFGIELTDENHRQLWIPSGYAHGFCVLSEVADVHYKCTSYYSSVAEKGLRWDCPEIGIDWPVSGPILSERDLSNPGLSDLVATMRSRPTAS